MRIQFYLEPIKVIEKYYIPILAELRDWFMHQMHGANSLISINPTNLNLSISMDIKPEQELTFFEDNPKVDTVTVTMSDDNAAQSLKKILNSILKENSSEFSIIQIKQKTMNNILMFLDSLKRSQDDSPKVIKMGGATSPFITPTRRR